MTANNLARLDPAVCARQACDEGHVQAAGLLAADLRRGYPGCAVEAVRCRRGWRLEADFTWPSSDSRKKNNEQVQREMKAFLDHEGWPTQGIKFNFASTRDIPWSALITISCPAGQKWPPVPE